MKKAYIIPLVILLLFASVVPCFAQSAFISTYNYCNMSIVPYSDLGYTYSYNDNYCCISNNNGTNSFTSRNGWFGLTRLNPSESYFYYYEVLDSDSSNYWFSLFSYGDYRATPSQPYYYLVNNSSSVDFYLGLPTGKSITFFIVAFKLSELDIDSVDPDVIYNYLKDYDLLKPLPFGSVVSYDHSFYSPFFSFYSSLAHTFDYFGSITSTYSYIFVFVGAIIAVLVFIFLFVFLIKRFTGGKY